eukprot:9382412-Pyramimonas_sp.AAC.1
MRAAGKGVALDPTDPNVGIVTLDAGGEAWLEFETALFKGQMRIRVRGGQKKGPTPEEEDRIAAVQDYFEGYRRKSQIVVRGVFKQEVKFAHVLTGQEFDKPLLNLPGNTIQSLVVKWARFLNPALRIHRMPEAADGQQFLTVYSPLVSSLQVMHVQQLTTNGAPPFPEEAAKAAMARPLPPDHISEATHPLGGVFAEKS